MSVKFELQLGVAPVTVATFMRESEDNLFSAADQQFTGDGIRAHNIKLRRIENLDALVTQQGKNFNYIH